MQRRTALAVSERNKAAAKPAAGRDPGTWRLTPHHVR
jgi:hypothetical protein